jgi:hypothetical protein
MIFKAEAFITRASSFVQNAGRAVQPRWMLISYIAKEVDLFEPQKQEDCD